MPFSPQENHLGPLDAALALIILLRRRLVDRRRERAVAHPTPNSAAETEQTLFPRLRQRRTGGLDLIHALAVVPLEEPSLLCNRQLSLVAPSTSRCGGTVVSHGSSHFIEMGTDELPVETDPSDAANLKSDSAPGAHGPTSSNSIFLWQYEFEQSLINQQLQYQQQAVAMEVSIKAAALQAVTGAAEVGKLLNQENDASVVDVVKELTSSPRRLIGEVKPCLPSPTLEFLRSKSIPTSPIRLEEEGKEEESRQSTRLLTDGMRSSRSKGRRRNHRSTSRSCSKEITRRHKSRSGSRERRRQHKRRSRSRERRRRHRSRSRSRERRRRHRSRSKSREKRRRSRSRSRSKERRGRSRSRSRSRGRRHESISRRRSRTRRSRRSRSRSKSKSLEICKSGERNEKRMTSHTARSSSKGSTPDGISFPGKSICSEHFGVGESEGREEASLKMITGTEGQGEAVPHEK